MPATANDVPLEVPNDADDGTFDASHTLMHARKAHRMSVEYGAYRSGNKRE